MAFYLICFELLAHISQLVHFTVSYLHYYQILEPLELLLFSLYGFNLTTSLAISIWHLFVWSLHIFSFVCLQVVCSKYGISVESSTQIDRRALNYILNYYLNIDIHGCPLKVVLHFRESFLFHCQRIPSSLCRILCAHFSLCCLLGNIFWLSKGIVQLPWTRYFHWYHQLSI